MITLSWALGNPLTLLFDPLESIILLLTGQLPVEMYPAKLTNLFSAYSGSCESRRKV